MAAATTKAELEQRQKKQLAGFSNYENAVTFVSSLEAWFEHRWGPEGVERAGLLQVFNRFPLEDGLTPDFEVRFHTPYVLWGDHKRSVQAASTGRDDAVQQIIGYAEHACKSGSNGPPKSKKKGKRDILLIVGADNDDVAAEAIDQAREKRRAEVEGLRLAPIIVLGCFRDPETQNGEWYRLKWRRHHRNKKFSKPNVCTDSSVPDLNALITAPTRHAIPVNREALGRAGRHPFINDQPPPLYTTVRLVIGAISQLMTEDERDVLNAMGRVEKTLTKDEVLGTDAVTSLNPIPRGLPKWIEASLEFMTSDLKWATKVPRTNPQAFRVAIDRKVLSKDVRELFSARAAKKMTKGALRRAGFKGDTSAQLDLF